MLQIIKTTTTGSLHAWLLIIVCLLWPVSFAQAAEQETLSLTFGVYQTERITVIHRKFRPILDYLANRLSVALNRPVKLRMRIFKGYEEANDAIVNGEVDFVRFGPASYIQAKTRNGALELIAMEERKGQNHFYGVIIVSVKSPINAISELKGHSFAFGDERSTIGHYLSQKALVEAGVHANDLAGFDYLGRHDKVFDAVALHKYDAGALKETTVSRYNNSNMVRVISRFNNMTKPWISRAGLDRYILQTLRTGLLQLNDAVLLKELKVTGFLPATDADYEETRKAMQMAEGFGG